MTLPTPQLPIPTSVRKLSPVVIIGATLALVFVAAGLLVATLFAPAGRDTTVIIGFVVSVVGPTILGLLTLIRGDHAAKLGADNARKLDLTIATVDQVARDVNGHLARHDTLEENVMQVAKGVAQVANAGLGAPRNPDARTRATDTPQPPASDQPAQPLADQQ